MRLCVQLQCVVGAITEYPSPASTKRASVKFTSTYAPKICYSETSKTRDDFSCASCTAATSGAIVVTFAAAATPTYWVAACDDFDQVSTVPASFGAYSQSMLRGNGGGGGGGGKGDRGGEEKRREEKRERVVSVCEEWAPFALSALMRATRLARVWL
jgi:hypothetical protein